MGLDTVELVIEVEESFGITIADSDAEKIRTVGDLYRYVLERLAAAADLREREVCPTAHAFYASRRALAGVLNAEPRSIRPSTTLRALIGSRRRRRATWENLRSAMTLRLPDLQLPRWAVRMILISPLVVAVAVAVRFRLFVGDAETAATIGILTFLGVFVLMVVLSRFLATRFPGESVTMADLSREVARLNFGAIAVRTGSLPTPDEVWEALRLIVIEQLGARPEDVTEDARFVEDLGAD